jgi:hypothetical protein
MPVRADRDGHRQVLADQAGQIALLRQAHHRRQPAQDTRFGSSNCTDVSLALCNNRISQMPFGLGAWGLRKHHHPSSEGICPVTTRSTRDNRRCIQAQGSC